MANTTALALLEFGDTGAATGHRLVDPAEPHLRVTDLSATRGDGVFETVSLIDGLPLKLDRHLERMANSARLMDLPAQDPEVWREAVHAVASTIGRVPEAWAKLVLSRGVEGGPVPTGWVYGEVSVDWSELRSEGLRIVLLDRGYSSELATTAPWLLAGAKTLSYAINRSAYREAARRAADDVVFTTTDGYLLEGPTSTLLLRTGTRFRTPRPDLGILPGTTQAELFAWAEGAGTETSYELLTPDDLIEADAAWLVSSVRLAVPIRAVDGIPKPVDVALTAAMNAHLRSLARA